MSILLYVLSVILKERCNVIKISAKCSFSFVFALQSPVVNFPKSQSKIEEPEQQLTFSDTQFHVPSSITCL